MSRQNKVNPGQYYVAGRLTPDELARERVKQHHVSPDRDTAQPKVMKAGAGTGSKPSPSGPGADRARRLQKSRP
jgi:hypothetical protein